MAIRPTPIRIDPVELLTKKSKSSKAKNHPKPKKSRKQSRKQSRSKSRKQSQRSKLIKKEEKEYQVPKLERKQFVQDSPNRVSPGRAIQQRLSPYFGQDHNNRCVDDCGPDVIKDLKMMEKRTRNKSELNQLVKENILVRSTSKI